MSRSTTAAPRRCSFNGCPKSPMDASTKCSFHRNRSQCRIPTCSNQVYARQLCVRHGGKKVCETPGCTSHACGGGHCLKHGGVSSKRFCLVEGCQKQAHKDRKCVRHGGGRYCKTPHCSSHARFGGYCWFHNDDLEPIKHTIPQPLERKHLGEMDDVDSAILEWLVTYGIHDDCERPTEDSPSSRTQSPNDWCHEPVDLALDALEALLL